MRFAVIAGLKAKTGLRIRYLSDMWEEFKFSSYLHAAIPDEKTRLVANLITHYRHEHQKAGKININTFPVCTTKIPMKKQKASTTTGQKTNFA